MLWEFWFALGCNREALLEDGVILLCKDGDDSECRGATGGFIEQESCRSGTNAHLKRVIMSWAMRSRLAPQLAATGFGYYQ